MDRRRRRGTLSAALILLGLAGALPRPGAQTLDGRIGEGEYAHTLELADGRFILAWRIEGERIHLALSAEAPGWVMVGLDPIVLLDSADLLIGWVADGAARVIDAWSLGPNGPVAPDVELGGVDNILEQAGAERDGRTTVELSRLLETGDPYDRPIPAGGGNKLVWAYGRTDDYRERAEESGTAWLRPGVSGPLGLGIALLTAAFLAAGAAALVSAARRRRAGLLRAHLGLLAASALLSGGALVAAVGAGGLPALLAGLAFLASLAAVFAAAAAPARAGGPAHNGSSPWSGPLAVAAGAGGLAALLAIGAALAAALARAGLF